MMANEEGVPQCYRCVPLERSTSKDPNIYRTDNISAETGESDDDDSAYSSCDQQEDELIMKQCVANLFV
jgi:hypothetical protein